MELALSSDLETTAFYPEPTCPLVWGLHLMCLICTLRIYLQRMEHTHGPNRSLFFGTREGPIALYRSDRLAPVLQKLFVLLTTILAGSMKFSMQTLIRYRAWQPPGPKSPQYQPRKSALQIPGPVHALLPNSTGWTFLTFFFLETAAYA